jgi:hypothetical protein
MDNPVKLATLGTQDTERRTKNTAQYVDIIYIMELCMVV